MISLKQNRNRNRTPEESLGTITERIRGRRTKEIQLNFAKFFLTQKKSVD